MSVALAYLPINKVGEGWLMTMENLPQNKELTLFLDCFFEQLMENQNVSKQMWNTNKHRRGTKNAIEGWNSKLTAL